LAPGAVAVHLVARVLRELDGHQLRPQSENLDALVHQLLRERKALFRWPADADIAMNHCGGLRLSGPASVEVPFAELTNPTFTMPGTVCMISA
jgi:hypothetical protein